MTKWNITIITLLVSLSWTSVTSAQEAHEGMSADEVAKELANPTSSLANLTFKNQLRLYQGDLQGASSQANYTNLFQPVFPFTLPDTASGGKANLFIRPAIPFLFEQPAPGLEDSGNFAFDHETQIGDIGFDIAYGVTEPDGLIYAFGMVGTLPTATSSSIAGGQLRLGPEFFIGKAWDKGLIGIFPNHQWDVAGWNESAFSTTQIQPFLKFLPGDGWSIGSLPIIDYNWETEEWTVPINLTIGKTLKVGKMPLKVELEANYYFESPNAFGPEWMIGLNITPVVPNFIQNMIRGK